MGSLEAIFILLFASVLLVGVAQWLRIPYPLALVVGGIGIGFLPFMPPMNFDPNLVLLIFLPPILYYSSFSIAFREFRKNWRAVFSLAIGLVVFTTLVIGVLFKWVFPQYSWALAFAFGAIVSPPDATSATAILRRFSINPRLASLLEGESLINDASAIVLYKIAVSAALLGSFSLVEGGAEFVREIAIGVFVGVAFGYLLQIFSRRYLEPVLAVVFSFTIPYMMFIVSNYLGGSGVLAVVACGLIGSRVLLKHRSSLRRVLGFATWDILFVLLNCFIFVLIGLKLRSITGTMTYEQIALYTAYACLFTLAMVIIRLFWTYAIRNMRVNEAIITGWSGMRGIVSLSIALGLPLQLSGRDEVIFITFVVILITLLIPGLTLPLLIRRLIPGCTRRSDEGKVREKLIVAAKEKLRELLNTQVINENEFEFLGTYFVTQHRVLSNFHENKTHTLELARVSVIQSQRDLLLELWEKQEIDDGLLNHMENELDIVEIHIARGELN